MAARGQHARARSGRARRRRTARAAGLARLGVVLVLLVLGAVAAWHVFGGGGTAAHARSTASSGVPAGYVAEVSKQARSFTTPPTVTGLSTEKGHNPWKLPSAVLAGIPVTDVVLKAGPTHDEVALTFDDGPSTYTPGVLRTLARFHVHATFFMIGREAKAFPDAVRAVLAGGNAIGDHTWSHPDLAQIKPAERRNEILGTAQELNAIGSPTPTLVRPPYGATTPTINRLIRSLGMVPINWDVDTEDWRPNPSVDAIVAAVVNDAKPGSIVLMHDGGGDRSATVAALPRILAILRNRGVKVVTVPQLLATSPPEASDLLSSYGTSAG